jgi:putative spermidine/putrescine transport system substrate-binding protein
LKLSPSRLLRSALLALGLGWAAAASAQTALCYNCPPEWADWGGMLRLINQRLNIAVPPDNKNSGQSLAALIAEAWLSGR